MPDRQRQVRPRRRRDRHRLRGVPRGRHPRHDRCGPRRAPAWSASSARRRGGDHRPELPNVVFAAGRVQAWLLGSGWGDGPTASGDRPRSTPGSRWSRRRRPAPPAGPACPARVLLTPHAGELARLLDCERAEVEADPLARSGPGPTGPVRPCCSRGRPSWSPCRAPDGHPGRARPGLDRAGRLGRHPRRDLRRPARRRGRARTAAALAASVQALTAARLPGPLPPQELARGAPWCRRARTAQELGDEPPSTRHGVGRDRPGRLRGQHRALHAHVAPAAVMVVVKADAYGHGMVVCARAAREAGPTGSGSPRPPRRWPCARRGPRSGAGLAVRTGEDLTALLAADVDVSAQSEQRRRDRRGATIAERRHGSTSRSTPGCPATAPPWGLAAVCRPRGGGAGRSRGGRRLWSHFAAADEPALPRSMINRWLEVAYQVALTPG